MYLPTINPKASRLVAVYAYGPYQIGLWTDCANTGPSVKFRYVMTVLDANGQPCYAVASEESPSVIDGSMSYVLGVFPGDPSHQNLGHADDWANLDHFHTKALQLITEHFKLDESPKPLKLVAP